MHDKDYDFVHLRFVTIVIQDVVGVFRKALQ